MCGSTFVLSSWGWVHFGRKSLITLTVHLAHPTLRRVLHVEAFCAVGVNVSRGAPVSGVLFRSTRPLRSCKRRHYYRSRSVTERQGGPPGTVCICPSLSPSQKESDPKRGPPSDTVCMCLSVSPSQEESDPQRGHKVTQSCGRDQSQTRGTKAWTKQKLDPKMAKNSDSF